MLFIQPDFQDNPLPLFDLHQMSTVLDLKVKLEHYWHWLRYFNYQLKFSERMLVDDETLGHYGIADQFVVNLKILSPNKNPQGIPLTLS